LFFRFGLDCVVVPLSSIFSNILPHIDRVERRIRQKITYYIVLLIYISVFSKSGVILHALRLPSKAPACYPLMPSLPNHLVNISFIPSWKATMLLFPRVSYICILSHFTLFSRGDFVASGLIMQETFRSFFVGHFFSYFSTVLFQYLFSDILRFSKAFLSFFPLFFAFSFSQHFGPVFF
jgi:hypothetical protein